MSGTHVEVIVCSLSEFSLSTMWVRGIVLGLSVWQQEPCSIKTKYVRHTCKRWWYHLMTSIHKTHSYVLMQKKDQAKVGLSGACRVLAERLNQGSLEDWQSEYILWKGFIRCCGLCSSTIAVYTGEAETIIAVPYPLLDASAIPISHPNQMRKASRIPREPSWKARESGFQCQPRRQQWHRYTYQHTEQANNTFASGLLGIWTASRRCCLPRGRVFPPLLILPGRKCVLLIPDPIHLKSWLTLTLSYLNWTCERLTLFYKQWKYLGHKNHAEWTCSLLSLCPFTQQEAFGIHVVFYPSSLAVSS